MPEQKQERQIRVRILADGQELKAKPFVQQLVASTVQGLLQELKGMDQPRRLEIIIERP
ncbi:MAG: hypothetical protein AB1814_04225 [Thermodesulfobacteriota bacterium]